MKLKTEQVSLLFSLQSLRLLFAVSPMPQDSFPLQAALKAPDCPNPICTFLFLNEDVHSSYTSKQVPGYFK